MEKRPLECFRQRKRTDGEKEVMLWQGQLALDGRILKK